jgi:hypothetical protein
MKVFKLLTFGLSLLVALFSCKKDDSNIGAYISVNPNKISAEVIDSFEIIAYSKPEDSVITSGRYRHSLGSIYSDEVGLAKSSLFASLIPDSLDRFFPNSNYEIDSFYIELSINDTYGKITNQEFDVYMTTESVIDNSTYYNFDSLQVGAKIGTFLINVADSGVYKFDLDKSAGEYLISNNQIDYESNDAFKNFFKGIFISPKAKLESNSGAIYQLNSTGVSLNLTFSTTDDVDDLYDTNLRFIVENENYIFTRFHHDFKDSELGSVFSDSTLGENAIFIQGLSGSIGKLEFPTFQNWFDNDSINYLITKFEYKIYGVNHPNFPLPKQLFLTYTSSLGVRTYRSAIINSQENSYTFEINNTEVNTALEDGNISSLDFQISHPSPWDSPDYLKIYGVSSESPPKLKISYTRY